jgi:acyl carrier protein
MTQEQFLKRLQDEIQIEHELKPDDILADIQEWDSLAMLATLSVFDEIGIEVEINELEHCQSVRDIMKRACFDNIR